MRILAPQYYPNMPAGISYQSRDSIGMGAPGDTPGEAYNRIAQDFNTIPAYYTVSIDLAATVGATQAGSVALRPEPFMCGRITWATTGDVPSIIGDTGAVGSPQGRSVEVSWADEFVQFLGSKACLISALFADSQGFIDFPKPVLFQGKQSLSVTLRRLFWPSAETPVTTRFDFNFQGLSLLPPGVNQSGSAG